MNGKNCTKCGEFKEFGEFYKNRAAKDGLLAHCKKCEYKRAKVWNDANKERKAELFKAWYEDNKERKAEKKKVWREANKERIAETERAWKKNNPGKRRAQQSRRRAAKLQRTPAWADKLVIDMIYEDCPEGYHVDHIIPLQGELVSGLHTEWNLQYLPASENMSKGNRYEPE